MRVYDNVAYGLKLRHVPKSEIKERVEAVLERVNMRRHIHRFPAQLSGGELQRVALARSLVYEPKVLLLDELLSNLDAKIREKTRFELKNLLSNVGISAVYVIHDQEEAFMLSNRIVIMNHGRIVQVGDPITIYQQPSNEFVATFVGKSNTIRGKVISDQDGNYTVLILGQIKLSSRCESLLKVGDECKVVIRSNEIELTDNPSDSRNVIQCDIQASEYKGAVTDYLVTAGNETLTVTVNSKVGASFDAKRCFLRLNEGCATIVSKESES